MGLKYLEDPFKKVAYSFRIEEKLLEEIKLYAKATDKKLPETFNYLLKRSIENIHIGNTYLKDYEGIIINIPFLKFKEETYSTGDGIISRPVIFRRGNPNYLDYTEDGLTYEVKQIPNNLDVWYDEKLNTKAGYYSKQLPELQHEGVGLVIVPELVLQDDFYITQEGISNCLKFIYFTIKYNGDATATNISYKNCFRKLKEAGNEEILYKFKSIDSTIYRFSIEFMKTHFKNFEDGIPYEDDLNLLYANLLRFAKKYNDGNIINIDDIEPNFIENTDDELKEEVQDNEDSNKDEIISKLQEENKTLREQHQKELEHLETTMKQRVSLIEEKLNELLEEKEEALEIINGKQKS